MTAARDDERLRAEARARWHAVRAGAYPPWGALFALRPLLALALPGALRAVPAPRPRPLTWPSRYGCSSCSSRPTWVAAPPTSAI